MPYGCAIKDYSSGLCQAPSAHYKPYSRSTAVSPTLAMFPLGFMEIWLFCVPGDPRALPGPCSC